jgi:hypothetical protein
LCGIRAGHYRYPLREGLAVGHVSTRVNAIHLAVRSGPTAVLV